MPDHRIRTHPILTVEERPTLLFTWRGRAVEAREGETIAAALFAAGVRTFGHHPEDGAPQGLFCANGQCAQCLVTADGLPVKACMTPVHAGMRVEPLDGLPVLPELEGAGAVVSAPIPTVEVECLIIGGGPAGLSAAAELGRAGVRTLLVDDKRRLGGKLVLQTHKFFGSIEACHAGTRGIDIAEALAREVARFESVLVWLDTTALAVFSDRRMGVLRQGRYVVVHPHVLLVAAGARERSLVFPGNTLPGVYGAGAFQTLLNRDLVRPAGRLFVVGGGNVGLIAGYHALQAGIEVVGLCEMMPDCTGYKVHRDKLARLGVPIYTSHTVLSANGEDEVASVTIAQVKEDGRLVPGTERTLACDTILVAVGLAPVDEFVHKARQFGLPVFAAGDAEEIAEASAAMFTGRIRGLEVARALGRDVAQVPPEWHRTAELLKSRPGAVVTEDVPSIEEGVFPVLHCAQEIPCNPCESICSQGCIVTEGDDLLGLPEYIGENCTGCARCVAICPGLAIALVDYRDGAGQPLVTVPYEFSAGAVCQGDAVTVLDTEGAVLGEVEVVRVWAPKFTDRALLVQVRAPREIAKRIAGMRGPGPWETGPGESPPAQVGDRDAGIVCRCERVTAGQIRALIRAGVRDVNAIKAKTRAGMGACGGKTCTALIERLFREEGVGSEQVVEGTRRPLFVEVSLGAFAGIATEEESVGTRPSLEAEGPAARAADVHEWGL